MKYKTLRNRIHKLISKNDLKTAIAEMQRVLKESDKIKEIIIQSSRYSEVMRQLHTGLIDLDQAATAQNKISEALLHFLEELKEQIEDNPKLEKELPKKKSIKKKSKKVSTKKNTVKGKNKFIAGGNITIGDQG